MGYQPIILVADDEPVGRHLLTALLDGQGYTLVTAADGLETLEKAHAITPDLVLLDVVMPGLNGFEVCQQLRADPALAEVPIVLVTGLNDPESRVRGIEIGADAYVNKPVNYSELQAHVRSITRVNRFGRLRHARARFQWMAEQSPDGYIALDAAGRMAYANPQARRYLAAQPDATDLEGELFLAVAAQSYRCEPEAAWADWPDLDKFTTRRTRYLVRPESSTVPVMWLAVTVMDESPVADGTRLLCLHDVTQQVTTWRDMRTFHTVISHKLVTPLSNLVGCLEMAVYDPALSRADLLDLVGTAHASGEELHAVVDEILRYLKGDVLMQIGGHFPLRQFPDLAARVAAEYGVLLSSLRLESALLDKATGLSEQSLEWILWELLDNARKFHPKHEPHVEMSVSPAQPGWACITFCDDGVSLGAEQIAQVWAPYYQGEKIFTGETPGIGLGLPTIASLIWHVGGTCRLSNRTQGPGVVVELKVPLVNT